MEQVSSIRSSLCRLRRDVEKCRHIDMHALRDMIGSHDYMWDEPRLYSVADLLVRGPCLSQ